MIQPRTRRERAHLLTQDIEADGSFYALKDVTFDIKRGDIVGITGRNGAGKSTLLKILSRITEPTSGRAMINGRVASLLEVGTGFHPELTGRENVFLNGAVLGMKKAEIASRFDEIVAFAEVEAFLDTPVKRYSSGMYLRLAFAVAAHLEPEILIIDEILAVGDLAFQRKCLGKIQEVANHDARTVVFVSHDIAAVQKLCTAAVLLERGHVRAMGAPEKVIASYLSLSPEFAKPQRARASSSEIEIRLESLAPAPNCVRVGESATFLANLHLERPVLNARFAIRIDSLSGEPIVTFDSSFQQADNWRIERSCAISMEWPACALMPGEYRVVATLFDNDIAIDIWYDVMQLTVLQSDYLGGRSFPDRRNGKFVARVNWQIHELRVAEEVSSG